jgi:hypothetical protein
MGDLYAANFIWFLLACLASDSVSSLILCGLGEGMHVLEAGMRVGDVHRYKPPYDTYKLNRIYRASS